MTSKQYNYKVFWFAYDDCSFWFRLWNGYGLLIKNKHAPLIFSERVGAKGQRTHKILGYRVEILRPEKPYTWLGFFNRVFFQLLFVRLTKCSERRIVSFTPLSYDLILGPGPQASGSGLGMGVRGHGTTEDWTYYSFQVWIWPFTGWKSDFKFIGEPRFYRITKKRKIDEA